MEVTNINYIANKYFFYEILFLRSKNDSSTSESPAEKEDKLATSIVQQINRILISNLSSHKHILTAQVSLS